MPANFYMQRMSQIFMTNKFPFNSFVKLNSRKEIEAVTKKKFLIY